MFELKIVHILKSSNLKIVHIFEKPISEILKMFRFENV
jgi:hypothetical protein